jgi:protein-S-isoprenylcysteine O-methyltransferase Ste14
VLLKSYSNQMETFIKFYVAILLTVYFIGFFIKNILTIKRTGLSIKGKSKKVNLLISNSTLLYLLTFISVFHNPFYLFRISSLDIFSIKITGLVLIAIAFVLGMSALIAMGVSWRVGIKPEQKTELVKSGLYRFSRNPYFLSYNIMFFGIFLVFPSVVFAVFYLSFILIVHLMILDEEIHLTSQHNDAYLNYKKSVNRYLTLGIGK